MQIEPAEIESIKAAAREEGRREERRAEAKESCLIKLVELVVGAAIGGWFGYQFSPSLQATAIGAGVGVLLASGLWALFLLSL